MPSTETGLVECEETDTGPSTQLLGGQVGIPLWGSLTCREPSPAL